MQYTESLSKLPFELIACRSRLSAMVAAHRFPNLEAVGLLRTRLPSLEPDQVRQLAARISPDDLERRISFYASSGVSLRDQPMLLLVDPYREEKRSPRPQYRHWRAVQRWAALRSIDCDDCKSFNAAIVHLHRVKLRFLARSFANLYAAKRNLLERDDFYGTGVVAFLGALQRWNPFLSKNPWIYASPRVEGAMKDLIRQNAWISRATMKIVKRCKNEASEPRSAEQLMSEPRCDRATAISAQHRLRFPHPARFGRAKVDDEAYAPDETGEVGRVELVRKLLENLDVRQRVLITLRFGEAWPAGDIAQALGTTEPQVDGEVSDAIERLRRLGDNGE